MKKLLYFLPWVAVGLISCDGDDEVPSNCIEPMGAIVTETRTVSDFEDISLTGIGNIFLTQGAPQQLSVVTHDNLLSMITTNVVNEELQIDLVGCIDGNITQLDYVITIPDIEHLEINGVGNITGQNDFDLDKLEISLDGVGNVIVSGSSDTLEIVSSGVGNIMAFDLISQICEVDLIGAGNIEVTAESELDVNISGSGNVAYKGNPAIDVNITGSGNLIDAN
ncbi:MAG: DUF2807 domain-containing protein [Cyclobacteriaceae bacterium]|nr:DUF2807 domain-containing protein [Cyclobacteriaceae bacterium]